MLNKPGEFTKRVWELAEKIPRGRVTTYGILVGMAGGHPMMARMITTILSKSPNVEKVPWHRIVYANGRVWLDKKRKKERLRLYKEEGIKLDKNNKIVDFKNKLFTFE
ncbi:MAG: base-flipping protein [Microgenomates group bacterium GW2011_GWA2_40_6]|nr:MAG: base-flipping protein [Microgenomates group bacterium GW2011_GWA2_40_6]